MAHLTHLAAKNTTKYRLIGCDLQNLRHIAVGLLDMAINSHVLTYVQQHSRQYQATTPSSLGRATSTVTTRDDKASLKRNHLLSTFPYDQCSHPVLKDSKHSCRDGIIDALLNFSNSWAYEGLRQKNSLECSTENGNSIDFDSSNKTTVKLSVSLRYSKASGSILIRSPDCPNSQKLMRLVSDIFMSLLKRKAGIDSNGHLDEVIIESVTYGTNMFLQRFSSPDTVGLCQELLAAKENGQLNDILVFILDEIIYKHELLAFDRFQDAIVDSIVGDYDGKQNPESPTFYKLFKEIWRLSPGSFFCMSLGDVMSYRAEQCDSQFSAQENTIILRFEETAFTMNVTACYHAMRREFSQQMPRKTELTQKDLKELEVLLEAAVSYFLRTRNNTEIEVPKPKSKSLRFVDV